MKPPIVGPSGRIQTQPAKRAAARGEAGCFAAHLLSNTAETAAPAAFDPGEVRSLDALLVLQEAVMDGGEGSRTGAGIAHGERLLDALDSLRSDLLSGRLPEERLRSLVRLIDGRPGTSADARLEQIIGEIELRAKVELAKLDRRR